jgi:hypothetical protein
MAVTNVKIKINHTIKEYKNKQDWSNDLQQYWNQHYNQIDYDRNKFIHYVISNQDVQHLNPFTDGRFSHFWIDEKELSEESLLKLQNLIKNIPIYCNRFSSNCFTLPKSCFFILVNTTHK